MTRRALFSFLPLMGGDPDATPKTVVPADSIPPLPWPVLMDRAQYLMPSATTNGQSIYTLPTAPISSKALIVVRGGLVQAEPGDYTLNGNTITASGDWYGSVVQAMWLRLAK